MRTNKSVEKGSCGRVEKTPDEIEVLKFIFETILKTAKAPTLGEMQSALKKSKGHIVQTLSELEKKDLLLRKRGAQEIISIYPFSLIPTKHQVIPEDGERLFAMCAIDALGVPIMFSRDAKIISRCEKCKQEITIEIKNEEIVRISHPRTIIWDRKYSTAPEAESCCPFVNFFCCREHLENWGKENPGLSGETIDIRQGFPRIKQNWKLYGETLGFR